MVKFVKKFQMGGEMGAAPAPQPQAPAQAQPMPEGGAEQGADPVTAIVEQAMQALQSQDPQMALGVCEQLVQLVQGGAAAEAPAGGVPEEPVMMRKGGKMVAKKKKKC